MIIDEGCSIDIYNGLASGVFVPEKKKGKKTVNVGTKPTATARVEACFIMGKVGEIVQPCDLVD